MSGSAAPPRDILVELARLSPGERERLLRRLPLSARVELAMRWRGFELPGQAEPAGDWRVWLVLAGRGFGKTRLGSEWVHAFARAHPTARIALVGDTIEDVRRVMIEGESGLLATARDDEPMTMRGDPAAIRFASGAKAYCYSAAAGEKLRGPQHDLAWCDELAKWRRGDAAWDNLMMGLRLGDRPRVLVTTTPRAVPLLRRIRALPDAVETRGSTRDNAYLPASFVAAVEASYAGTRLGRQELDGEMVEDVAGALWTRALIEGCRVVGAPALTRVVVAVDPPAGIGGDACGIVAVGLGADGRGYVLEDATVAGLGPDGWSQAVAACAARHDADRVVAEANQGGEMVRRVLEIADAALPISLVHASRGKAARAEPVALLYERGKVSHVGAFPALEDQLCGLTIGGGYEGPGRSPDRADALVWALTALMLGNKGRASARVV